PTAMRKPSLFRQFWKPKAEDRRRGSRCSQPRKISCYSHGLGCPLPPEPAPGADSKRHALAIHEHWNLRVRKHFDRLAAEDNRRDTGMGHHSETIWGSECLLAPSGRSLAARAQPLESFDGIRRTLGESTSLLQCCSESKRTPMRPVSSARIADLGDRRDHR